MIKRKDGFSGERALVIPASVISDIEKNPLASSLYITDIGFYPHAQFHFRERLEPISQYILIYCVEGKGWFQVNQVKHTVGKNQCFVIPAGSSHSYGANDQEPWTIYWIHFKGTLAGNYAQRLYVRIEIKPSIHSRINGRISLFEEIFHTLEMGYSKDNILYACSALHYFMGTLCYLQPYRSADGSSDPKDLIEATIHFMKENIGKKMSVEEMAQHCGYSTSHFTALFTQRTGHSPISYFNQLKIQYACKLLDTTNIRINQVCYKIGIDDCYYFSRLFCKIMGQSPSAYRKQNRDNAGSAPE